MMTARLLRISPGPERPPPSPLPPGVVDWNEDTPLRLPLFVALLLPVPSLVALVVRGALQWDDAAEEWLLLDAAALFSGLDDERDLSGLFFDDDFDEELGQFIVSEDCPRCGKRMEKLTDPVQKHIQYEGCAEHGMYFDAGEFTDYKYETLMDIFRDVVAMVRR